MKISEQVFREWTDAINCAQFSNSQAIKSFKNKYPDEYRFMTSMLLKRNKVRAVVNAFRSVSDFIYWGDLTFNEEEDKKDESTKRKQVERWLSRFFPVYVYVVEYGEEKGRFHVHYFGIMSTVYEYNAMRDAWHSQCITIECMYKKYEVDKKIKYVTDYASKQVPRIRMNKRARQLLKDFKTKRHNDRLGFNSLNRDYFYKIEDLLDLPF